MNYYRVPVTGTGASIADARRPNFSTRCSVCIDLGAEMVVKLDGTLPAPATAITQQQALSLAQSINPEATEI
jgi:hypothetical protein